MRYEWQTQRISLDILNQKVKEFFKEKGFTTKTYFPTDERTHIKISATPTKNAETRERINIEVQKTPDGIAIEFTPMEKTEKTIKMGILSSFFIGGSLLLRGVKSKENLEALQREFWARIQKAISDLQS